MTEALIFGFGFLVGWTGNMWHRSRKTTGRKGIVYAEVVGAGIRNKGEKYNVTLFVTEVEQLVDGFSRIKITDVSGIGVNQIDTVKECVGNIVHSSEIKWITEPAPKKE